MPTWPATPPPRLLPEDQLHRPAWSFEVERIVRHVRAIHPVKIRIVRLHYEHLTHATFETFRAFIEARRGRAQRFEFAHPNGGAAYQARVMDESFEWRITGPGPQYAFTVTLEEVP